MLIISSRVWFLKARSLATGDDGELRPAPRELWFMRRGIDEARTGVCLFVAPWMPLFICCLLESELSDEWVDEVTVEFDFWLVRPLSDSCGQLFRGDKLAIKLPPAVLPLLLLLFSFPLLLALKLSCEAEMRFLSGTPKLIWLSRSMLALRSWFLSLMISWRFSLILLL